MRRWVRVPKSMQTGIWWGNRHRTMSLTSASIGECSTQRSKQLFRPAAVQARVHRMLKFNRQRSVAFRCPTSVPYFVLCD